MSNTIKYSTQTENNTLKKGNFVIGVNDVDYGPTSETGYYNTITPPEGGYVVYKNRGDNQRSIYVAESDEELVLLKDDFGATGTTANDVLVWAAQQDDVLILNNPLDNIVTDGLVLCLDAGFTCSYPKTGTKLYDLSGNENDGSVIVGSSYSSGNTGNINYGVNQNTGVVTLSPISAGLNLNNETYTFWAKCNKLRSSVAGGPFTNWIIHYGNYYGNNSGGFGLQSIYFSAYIKGSTSAGWSITSSSALAASIYDSYDWIYYTLQIVNNNNIKFYMNTTLIFNLTISDAYTQYGSNVVTIGRNMDMQFSNLQIYNRVLSSEEILQNYNAQKSRFGL